ncbi:sulfate thiosulfate transporter subunit : Sulfate/thiosulfate transporter subunit OS=Mesorhizobium sp. L48C026A00 GN=X737_29710 PE=4 SV=1: BPD_transp_1 [Gemmata massiliana]|uniref:Sulfate transport system permease protein CysT n=1 Tax=Gemmata massiliana TaxID=1210884 RepID=A0A6P2D2K3_9BACT|nr:sulfate ABC transporter permease subunit CysT [Gemmata massiliana]VTR95558.1 sulfate thiosulfate transporter subunit : Sulfate/thiosulfate transporter subunit OS=Mesorhizobium sp. L48C026A00 GN=X737_29710 PE=4 SV=1: BPD_transp_1 [Gemmata massiliana]
MAQANPRILPGYRLSISFTLVYLSVLVIIPLGACVVTATQLSWEQFRAAVWTERARAAYALTFGASLAAALISAVLGLLIAWVLVRYEFPGRRIFDALVDLPFALPTAVAGLVFSNLYVANGWLGQFLVPLGIEGSYSRLAVVLVLTFIGFPFVVRTLQPVLGALDAEAEEAAALLGASRWQTFRRVTFPALLPGLLTGFALAFARGLGEYGSVVFVSGNMPLKTEIAAFLIVSRLEEGRPNSYREATAIATVLLAASFLMLVFINRLEARSRKWSG